MKNFPVLPVLVLFFSFRGFAQPKDSVQFKKIILTKDFVSEGVAVGDVNRDGLVGCDGRFILVRSAGLEKT